MDIDSSPLAWIPHFYLLIKESFFLDLEGSRRENGGETQRTRAHSSITDPLPRGHRSRDYAGLQLGPRSILPGLDVDGRAQGLGYLPLLSQPR